MYGTALGAVAVLSGCSAAHDSAGQQVAVPQASISVSVENKAVGVAPSAAVQVSTDGALGEVSLASVDGARQVSGSVDANGVWVNDTPLELDTQYQLRAQATNAEGAVSTEERTFTTVTPKVDATYTVTPDGNTVGVGMPITVRFDTPVETPQQMAAVEKRLSVTTTPTTEGSWGWVDSTQLLWRPESYWKPGTKVKVNAPLTGVQTGSGKWIREDKGAEFTIADRARVIRVDLDDHFMRVVDNGKITAEYPISAGQARNTWETRSGTKVITEMHESYTMDAGTLGVPKDDPNYYSTDVKYAMRVTNTGEFFHSAPWSVGSQGRRNVSHGCVNMSPRDARQFFRGTMIGDPAEFVDSGRKMKPGDGVPVWLYTFDAWKAFSAVDAQGDWQTATGW